VVQITRVPVQDNGTPYCDHGFEQRQENSAALKLKNAPFREKWRNGNFAVMAGIEGYSSKGGAKCWEHECVELRLKITRPA
jgi:hypothetical protein